MSSKNNLFDFFTGGERWLAKALEAPRTEEERMEGLPLAIRKRVCLPERPIYQGKAKRARTTAAAYAQNHQYQVRFEDLKVGDVTLIFCPEDATTSVLAFRLHMGRSELSPWLYLVKIASINKDERQVTWLYFAVNQFTSREKKSVAIQKASQSKTWRIMTCTKQTSRWDEDEVVLSWERDAEDRGYSIPTVQYKQAQTVMLAVQQTTAVADED